MADVKNAHLHLPLPPLHRTFSSRWVYLSTSRSGGFKAAEPDLQLHAPVETAPFHSLSSPQTLNSRCRCSYRGSDPLGGGRLDATVRGVRSLEQAGVSDARQAIRPKPVNPSAARPHCPPQPLTPPSSQQHLCPGHSFTLQPHSFASFIHASLPSSSSSLISVRLIVEFHLPALHLFLWITGRCRIFMRKRQKKKRKKPKPSDIGTP